MLTKFLGAVGAVLLVVGVVLAVRPVHAGGDACGSVFQPGEGITPMQCDARLSSRGTLAAGFGAGGLALGISALTLTAIRDRRARSTS
ncbi:hypothetical protein [Kribbella sp.]|uniref:hypothetical protein n=1 Tax=Kribbella sp. TaxID=1871183 RepID=UPI002D52BCBB|nr:hypothetical protein [Kribbella sp.]HZX04011.1 hypothetical protein [Kribbella sp.]